MTDNVLVDLVTLFARLSLVAIGGMNTVMPEIIREVVDVRGWMTTSQLADLIAESWLTRAQKRVAKGWLAEHSEPEG